MGGVFPTSLNKIFVPVLLAGKEDVSDQNFIEGFLEYISSYDSLRIQKILAKCSSQLLSSEDVDFLVDFCPSSESLKCQMQVIWKQFLSA